MQIQTEARKSHINGNTVDSTASLGLLGKEGEYFLRLSTSKNSRGVIQTHAGVFLKGEGFERTRFPEDFCKYIPVTEKITRATMKNVEKVHGESMKLFEVAFQEAIIHTLPIVE